MWPWGYRKLVRMLLKTGSRVRRRGGDLGGLLTACRERLLGPVVRAQASRLCSFSHSAGLGLPAGGLQRLLETLFLVFFHKPQSPWQRGTGQQRWLYFPVGCPSVPGPSTPAPGSPRAPGVPAPEASAAAAYTASSWPLQVQSLPAQPSVPVPQRLPVGWQEGLLVEVAVPAGAQVHSSRGLPRVCFRSSVFDALATRRACTWQPCRVLGLANGHQSALGRSCRCRDSDSGEDLSLEGQRVWKV